MAWGEWMFEVIALCHKSAVQLVKPSVLPAHGHSPYEKS